MNIQWIFDIDAKVLKGDIGYWQDAPEGFIYLFFKLVYDCAELSVELLNATYLGAY